MTDKKTDYDSDWNRTGHSEREGDRTTHYDKDWNRTGYTEHDGDSETHYDKDWNKTGHSERRGSRDSHYDRNWNRTGYTEHDGDSETHYDKDWDETGHSEPSKGGCFISSACIAARGLPDDCHELQVLRRFRDEHLLLSTDGRKLVASYYRVAPELVAQIDARQDRAALYDQIHTTLVVPCVELLERHAFGEARELYEATVKRLVQLLLKSA